MAATFHIPASHDATVSIEGRNILSLKGTKVIHCSKAFDTDRHVVRDTSVFGQWLKMCSENNVDVDGQIDFWLDAIRSKGLLKNNLPCRKLLFPAGELCPVDTGDGVVCLAGFCNTTNAFVAETVTLRDYVAYWDNMWYNMAKLTVDKRDVSVTVPGGKAVTLTGCSFDLAQSLGVIIMSYFKFAAHNTPIAHLHICIGEESGNDFEFEAWEKHIMPYLWGFASLPIRFDVLEMKGVKPLSQVCSYVSTAEKKTAIEQLLDDLRLMTNTAAANNGMTYEQYEGSKRVCVDVRIEKDVLLSVIREIEWHPNLVRYFGKTKGNSYDRNAVFQILGTLIERSSCYGNLNRRSVVTLCMGGGKEDRWKYLGDSLDNIINYVGQRLKTFKTARMAVYDELANIIPPEWRK